MPPPAERKHARKPRTRTPGQVTIAEVAAKAGVSAITVSRALQTPERVSAELRARIEQVVRELGYVPNRAARTLASARSHTVVVLVPSLSNTVFIDTLNGIYDVLRPQGYQLLIGNTHYSPAEEERLLTTYRAYNPDGFLITGGDHSSATRRLLAESGTPTVYMMELDEEHAGPHDLCVGLSQKEAAQTMTRYLLERGYRRIAFLAAQLDPRTLQRREGYRQVLRAAGRYDPAREVAVPDPSTVGLGAELLDRLLRQAPDCDAVFCCNDDLAQGALFQCQRRGLRVPGQLAIAGFNDLAASAWTVPSITTIATPRYAIGHEAARMLLEAIAGHTPSRTRLDLGFTLMARESA
ncbi:MAG TPA: LacI family DNA-binding transcriptional regulator [Candidatus Competibacteraceae bacterium]|nr:LacI family DNA-binding transcriptional regulator [Candidatus Competibacteraceae bacterium]